MSNTSGDRSIQRREGGGDEAIARRLGSNVKKKKSDAICGRACEPLVAWLVFFLLNEIKQLSCILKKK
jgi:hypothetical protein